MQRLAGMLTGGMLGFVAGFALFYALTALGALPTHSEAALGVAFQWCCVLLLVSAVQGALIGYAIVRREEERDKQERQRRARRSPPIP